mmetsp:Transcript_19561/g.39821  ORF Transcript_19561/g.39821 Transcript_19561/m.39821 type:complete len:206 (+) Transcript_19561:231-848(+)
MRNLTTAVEAAPTWERILNCTVPLPCAFLKDAPPRASSTFRGRITILNSMGQPHESSKVGDAASLSLLLSLLASTVQRIRWMLLVTLKALCKALSRSFFSALMPKEGSSHMPAGQRAKRSMGTNVQPGRHMPGAIAGTMTWASIASVGTMTMPTGAAKTGSIGASYCAASGTGAMLQPASSLPMAAAWLFGSPPLVSQFHSSQES